MDEQRPAERSTGWERGRPEPIDAGADGPPPPPTVPPAATPRPPAPAGAGPPPRPPAAAADVPTSRRLRSRWPLAVALLAVVVVVPIALVLLSGLGEDEGPGVAQGDDPAGDAEPGGEGTQDGDGTDDGADDRAGEGEAGEDEPGDGGAAPDDRGTGPGVIAPDAELAPLDLAALEGIDRTYGRLLTDIDASERTMIAFQAELAEAFGDAGSREDALDGASEVATEGRGGLLEVRGRLTTPLDDPGADRVRELYVAHLDAWEGFMAAVAADPLAAFEQGESGATVRINATADAFARALEAELPADVDAEVERYAEQLLDRGFRDMGYADV